MQCDRRRLNHRSIVDRQSIGDYNKGIRGNSDPRGVTTVRRCQRMDAVSEGHDGGASVSVSRAALSALPTGDRDSHDNAITFSQPT